MFLTIPRLPFPFAFFLFFFFRFGHEQGLGQSDERRNHTHPRSITAHQRASFNTTANIVSFLKPPEKCCSSRRPTFGGRRWPMTTDAGCHSWKCSLSELTWASCDYGGALSRDGRWGARSTINAPRGSFFKPHEPVHRVVLCCFSQLDLSLILSSRDWQFLWKKSWAQEQQPR